MPDVPTLSEAGFPGINLFGGSFYSLAAPRGLPGEIAQKLFQAFSAAAADTDTRKKLGVLGLELNVLDAPALTENLRREFAASEKLVKTLNITITD
jgi:tripartite-type tricarboxylate transporter receptor subunit TctC